MIFEEAGEFKRLKNAYMSSKACFMDGAMQYGVPVVGGTGGDISKASKDFMDMYYEHEAYNLIPMFIPASRAYYGYFNVESGKEDEPGARKVLLEEVGLDYESLTEKVCPALRNSTPKIFVISKRTPRETIGGTFSIPNFVRPVIGAIFFPSKQL